MHVIYLSKIQVFPVDGGENLRAYGLLKILNDSVDKLSIIIPIKNHDTHEIFNNSTFYNYKYHKIHQIFPFYKEKKLTTIISKINQQTPLDIAFIDYSFYGQYINWFKSKNIKVIYGTHNSQANLIKHMESKKLITNLLNKIYYIIAKNHEKIYFKNADKLIVVSEEDKLYHSKFIGTNKLEIIPNFLNNNDYSSHIKHNKVPNLIAFCANFFSFQNIEGLKWFINNVWDDTLNSKSKLLLIGKGSKEIYLELKLSKFDSISYTGKIDNIGEFLSKAKVSIIPLLHGSGSRLKCLESMAIKTQIVSTKKGAEGIDHDNTILIADNPKLFKKLIIDVLDGKKDFTDKANEIFINKYSSDVNIVKLQNILNKI